MLCYKVRFRVDVPLGALGDAVATHLVTSWARTHYYNRSEKTGSMRNF